MNEWTDDEGDCRTAPATPGLLNTLWYFNYQNSISATQRVMSKENPWGPSQPQLGGTKVSTGDTESLHVCR